MTHDGAREIIASFLGRYGEDQPYRQAEVLLGKLDDGGVVLNGITDDEWTRLAGENERLRAIVGKTISELQEMGYGPWNSFIDRMQRALDVSGEAT